ncbi:MAG: hypothetical protein NTV01_20675 [Bacteroidia bacterium]|nr:hypothetical protein [Bacteroidia bacterium]
MTGGSAGIEPYEDKLDIRVKTEDRNPLDTIIKLVCEKQIVGSSD